MLRIVCKFSVCMEYPDDLLYLPESAKHNSSTLKSFRELYIKLQNELLPNALISVINEGYFVRVKHHE